MIGTMTFPSIKRGNHGLYIASCASGRSIATTFAGADLSSRPVTKALTIVTNILDDEAARVALGNVVFGNTGSWNPHGGSTNSYV